MRVVCHLVCDGAHGYPPLQRPEHAAAAALGLHLEPAAAAAVVQRRGGQGRAGPVLALLAALVGCRGSGGVIVALRCFAAGAHGVEQFQ